MVKTLFGTLAGVLGALWLWRYLTTPGTTPFAGAWAGSGAIGGSGGGSGAGGGGASVPGAPGAPGSGVDYAALAAAIQALANGVRLPNIQTVTRKGGSSGTFELVPGLGGKRVVVMAISVMSSGARSADFQAGGVNLWRIDLDAPAGNSGANLAVSWPAYLFATNSGEALEITLNGAATVSVTYWTEDI